jgi:Dynein light intermediate chain (DLIC)
MVMQPENLEYTSAVIVLDFDQPWEMVNALNRWLSILKDAVHNVIRTLPLATQDQIRERVAMHIKNYEIGGTAPAIPSNDTESNHGE